jgi:tRNA isopentenyl-2-thiomethyl-A-37 hydroxylase MiaE
VTTGKTSLEDALVVGATIEDMDIADLQENLTRTDNEDIATVYRNLLRGSRNHLRAFAKAMDRYDVTYEARYISAEEYEAIVTSSKERGTVDADGNRVRSRKGRRRRR